jgi:hypothetical protein
VCETGYRNLSGRLRFRCPEGHTCETKASQICRGNGCPHCANSEHGRSMVLHDGLAQLKRMAASRGGICLATTYTATTAKYPFRCAHGHEWLRKADLVLRGHWCRRCRDRSRMLTLEQMQELAQARGGRCLSSEYRGSRFKLMWECAHGHAWETTPGTILDKDRWCPNCARLAQTKNHQKRKRYDADGYEETAPAGPLRKNRKPHSPG